MSGPAFFFRFKGTKLLLTLPSGKVHMFYGAVPGQTPVFEERDVRFLRAHSDFEEVVPVTRKQGDADAGVIYVTVEEAAKLAEQRTVTRKAVQQAAETAATGEGAAADVPPAPATTGVTEVPAKPRTRAKKKPD